MNGVLQQRGGFLGVLTSLFGRAPSQQASASRGITFAGAAPYDTGSNPLKLGSPASDSWSWIMAFRTAELDELNPIAGALRIIFIRHVFGTGIQIHRESNDDEWNERADDSIEEICQGIHLGNNASFLSQQAYWGLLCWCHGDCFLYWVEVEGRLRCQTILASQCRSPGVNTTGNRITSGIEFDESNEVVAYWIATDLNNGNPQRIPAAQIDHLRWPGREWMARGQSPLCDVMRPLGDMETVGSNLMEASKELTTRIINIFTESGELTESEKVKAQMRQSAAPAGAFANATVAATPESNTGISKAIERVVNTAKNLMPKAVVMGYGKGVKVEMPDIKTPSDSTMKHLAYVKDNVCIKLGLSAEMITPTGLSGPGMRAVLEGADGTFSMVSDYFAGIFKKINDRMLEWACRRDPALALKPRLWWKTEYTCPASVTIDKGRVSDAELKMFRAGLLPMREITGPRGLYWRGVARQTKRERAYFARMGFTWRNGELVTLAEAAAIDAGKSNAPAGNQPPAKDPEGPADENAPDEEDDTEAKMKAQSRFNAMNLKR